MNKKLFLWLYTNTQKNKTLSNVSIFVTAASRFFYSAVYAAYFVMLSINRDLKIIPYIIFPVLTLIISKLLRHWLKRPRPFSELEIRALIEHKNAYSFPSNHSASAMVISVAVSYADIRIGALLFVFAIITGISRVQTGIHYPLDVLAGWITGLLLGSLGYIFI